MNPDAYFLRPAFFKKCQASVAQFLTVERTFSPPFTKRFDRRFRGLNDRTGEKENYVTGYKQYSKECTIRINYISTESIKAISVVKAVEEITGLNSVLAVVRDSKLFVQNPDAYFLRPAFFKKCQASVAQFLTVERTFSPPFTKRLDRRLRGLNDNIEIK
jgi:hypothetical protein